VKANIVLLLLAENSKPLFQGSKTLPLLARPQNPCIEKIDKERPGTAFLERRTHTHYTGTKPLAVTYFQKKNISVSLQEKENRKAGK
jgi:hypothetical protein